MALPQHSPQAVQVRSKSDGNGGHFTVEAETVFRVYLAKHGSRMAQTLHLAHTPLDPRPVKVWSKWSSNEGHFTPEVKTVSRPSLALYCSGVTGAPDMALLPHAPQTVEIGQ
jgi:acyl-coenzyme A synthetase/AMP-(fatty) acid ligase